MYNLLYMARFISSDFSPIHHRNISHKNLSGIGNLPASYSFIFSSGILILPHNLPPPYYSLSVHTVTNYQYKHHLKHFLPYFYLTVVEEKFYRRIFFYYGWRLETINTKIVAFIQYIHAPSNRSWIFSIEWFLHHPPGSSPKARRLYNKKFIISLK